MLRTVRLATTSPFAFCALLIGIFLGVATQEIALGADPSYLAELLRRSTEARLAEDRYWRLLLHYRANLLGGYTSDIDDPRFFLAPEGKTDPHKELKATLSAFFSSNPVGGAQFPAQCAFLARYHWLKAALSLDEQRLPEQSCEQFDRWLRELNPAGVTFVFPSAYMHNPASLFGHTLLRIDQRGQTEQTRLLAYTINYGAQDTSTHALGYVVAGVSGGFRGHFSIKPYHVLVKGYGDVENRDIWEYRLRLGKEQVERMLWHVWELKNHYLDYFFFRENCAYQLLAVLETAAPDLHLTDPFRLWTVPADTVRLLAAQPGLVAETMYRPAPTTILRQRQAALSDDERRILRALLHDSAPTPQSVLAGLPTDRQAFILHMAIDYLQYQRIQRQKKGEETFDQDRLHRLLIRRSHLQATSEQIAIRPFVTQPDLGHGTLRAGFGVGQRQGDWFEEATVRAGYHSLLDPDLGYTPNAHIELLALHLRHYFHNNRIQLDRLTLADMVSLSPWDFSFPVPSWKVKAELETVTTARCRRCYSFRLTGGIGVAAETRWLRRAVPFILPELDVAFSSAFANNVRLAGGSTAGILVPLTDRWKLLATGAYLLSPFDHPSGEVRVSAGQSYAVAKHWVVQWEFQRWRRDDEMVLRLHRYF